jgi:hypothetical protein
VQKLGLSESGRRLISFGADGLLCLRDLESGEMLTKREFTSQGVRTMALDHAGGGLLLLINNQIMVLRHERSPGT